MKSHKLWCPPKYVPFALFNYSSLHYNCVLHCLCLVHLQVTDLSWTKQVLTCRTGIIFSCITGKQRHSWSEQEVPHARWGKTFFSMPYPVTRLVFLTRLKSENKRHFMQAISRKQKVQINPTVSILARELTIFFHYKLKLKSQPFSVFDQVF